MARKKKVKKAKKSVRSKGKSNLVLKNLIVFFVLSLISVGLYNIFTNELIVNSLWMLALITGVLALALLIAYLVLFFRGFAQEKN